MRAPSIPEFIAIIPARRASTRLPDKALLDIAGLPMIVRTAQRARLSQATRVLVATDDKEIATCCTRFGIESVMTRVDHVSGTDRLAEVVVALQLPGEAIVVNVQGDEPLIEPSLIDRVAAALASASDCVMATACHPIADRSDLANPNIVKVVLDQRDRALYFSRAPIPWERDADASAAACAPRALRHVGLYAYRAAFLLRFPELAVAPLETIEKLEQLRALWHGERITCILSQENPAPGVDTPEDLERVRAWFSAQHN